MLNKDEDTSVSDGACDDRACDNTFYRQHITFRSETLQWLLDMKQVSPEDEWIARIDGEEEVPRGPRRPLPPIPSLDGIHDDLIWIFRCRESGRTWKEIAQMMRLKTASGAWKRYYSLLEKARYSV
jgi:hypothetical protein